MSKTPPLMIMDPKVVKLLSLVSPSQRTSPISISSEGVSKGLLPEPLVDSALDSSQQEDGFGSGYGFSEPLVFCDLTKSKYTNVQQRAWTKLVQSVSKTDGSPNIKRLEAGEGGKIDLDSLKPGEGAWVTPHTGPAAGRHILVVKRPGGDLALIGGLHAPNTVIEDGTEFLVNDRGEKLREATPEDYLSHLSHRHFAFKTRGRSKGESEVEKQRREKYAEFSTRRQAAQKEYKGALKQASALVREHRKRLHEALSLEEGTTLSSESEGKIHSSWTKAAAQVIHMAGEKVDAATKKLTEEFAKRATVAFRRQRRARIEQIENVVLSAAHAASKGKSVDSHINRLKQIPTQVDISAAPVEQELHQALEALQKGDTDTADQLLSEAADAAAATAFAHAEQQAAAELPPPEEGTAESLEPGNLPSGVDQDRIDALMQDANASRVDTGLNLGATISRFRSKERKKEEKQTKVISKPAYAQVDKDPAFETEADKQNFMEQVGEASRNYAIAKAASKRAKEEINKISTEMAEAGAEERPRTAVSPEELAVNLQTVEQAMAATGVSQKEINKELELQRMIQEKAAPTGPGFYTVLNDYWNDETGNMLDPHMRRGSEFALAGMMAENLPKEVLASEEVQNLLGKISTKVKFNQRTQRFEMPQASGQSQYGGLVHRTSGTVAPMIVARRLVQLAQRGERERSRIRDIDRQLNPEPGDIDVPKLSQQEKMALGGERARLKASPFAKAFGKKEMEGLIEKVSRWHADHVLGIEDKAMEEDGNLRQQIKEISEQTKAGEILSPEQKLGMTEKVNPLTVLGRMLGKTESLESLHQRRQENLGTALGSLETSAALGVALREAYVKGQMAEVGATKMPESKETAHAIMTQIRGLQDESKRAAPADRKKIEREIEKLSQKLNVFTSTPTISTGDDVRIDLPGPVVDDDPDKQASLQSAAKLAAYDYARNQLGLTDSEIHEMDGTALNIPKSKMAAIGIDKNGAHVRVRLGGPLTPEDVEAAPGAVTKKRARGLLDKITRLQIKQAADDRYADIKNNVDEPTRKDHPPLLRETRLSNPDQAVQLSLSQHNSSRFMQQPKLFDENGKPIRGSKGGLNTMVTGGGKTLASLTSIAHNHAAGEHMNYVISVPKGKVQDWLGDAREFTKFNVVGYTGGKKKPASGESMKEFEEQLGSQKESTPIVVAVPDGADGAKGYGITGWGKEQQHEFFRKIRETMEAHGGVAHRNVVFVLEHLVDSNIHSGLTKTQLSWGRKHAPGATEGTVIDHLSRLGVRGRIVDEPQTLVSAGETSNRSNAGKRIFSKNHPMEFRMLLTATPAGKALVEAYDAVRWSAEVPKMDSRGNYETNEQGRVQYHHVPLPSRTEFESQLGGLGRGTYTHEHLMQEQARQLFSPWNIGDEQKDRHYSVTAHHHSLTRTDSQRERQIEIERNAKNIIQRELEVEARRQKMPVEKLLKTKKTEAANAQARALRYIQMEHEQNINGAGVVREGRQVVRRKGASSQLPAVEHSNWKHNSKINALVQQVKKSASKDKHHQAVIVVDTPDQATAVKEALEQEVFPPTKVGRNKISQIGLLGRHTTGLGANQETYNPKPEEIDERKAKFKDGKLKVLIIDKDTAAGHNLQAADSLHMLGYLDTAGTIKQAHGRADRPGRALRSSGDIHGDIHGAIQRGGLPALQARRAIQEATGQDPAGMSEEQLDKVLTEFRTASPENYKKWQVLARKAGTFSEKPLEIHTYEMTDSPHELRTGDLRRRQMKNLEVTTRALMTKPEKEEEITHEPGGKETSRVTKGLFVSVPEPKIPLLLLRN